MICKHWRFKTFQKHTYLLQEYYFYNTYRDIKDFVGMDMARKFLEMGLLEVRRYANYKDGKKYDENGNVRAQEKDWATSDKAKSAKIFKDARSRVNSKYIQMRKEWRQRENVNV